MLPLFSDSAVNWILVLTELMNVRTFSVALRGITANTSSTYLFQIIILWGVFSRISFSIDYIVNSARTTEMGDPIGTPFFYL